MVAPARGLTLLATPLHPRNKALQAAQRDGRIHLSTFIPASQLIRKCSDDLGGEERTRVVPTMHDAPPRRL